MSRIVQAANETEAAKTTIRLGVLVDMDFSSGNLYLHDGIGTINFGGNNYLGVGQFGSIEGAVQDSLDVIARPIKLILSGVDSSVLTPAMTESYQGRTVTLYLAFLDSNTNALVATPETLWEGRMDYMEIELGDNTGAIKLNCEHRLRREPRIARYSDEDQQLAYSGDVFFELLPQIAGFKSKWGEYNQAYGISGAPVAPPNPRNSYSDV